MHSIPSKIIIDPQRKPIENTPYAEITHHYIAVNGTFGFVKEIK